MKLLVLLVFITFGSSSHSVLKLHRSANKVGEQPLSKIAIHKTVVSLRPSISIKANPLLLGIKVHYSINRFPFLLHSISLYVYTHRYICGR